MIFRTFPIVISVDWPSLWQWSDDSIIGSLWLATNEILSDTTNGLLVIWHDSPWLSALVILGGLSALLTNVHTRRHSWRQNKAVQSALDALPEAVALFDPNGRLAAVNEKLASLMPLSIEPTLYPDMNAEDLYSQISPDTDAIVQARKRARESASSQDATLSFELPSYGKQPLLVKERRTDNGGTSISVYGADHLANLRFSDPLTALASRKRLVHELAQRCSRTRGELALIIVDLKSFRQINDSYGRAVGDELLKQTGLCLRRAVPENALIARTGGDEFAILMESDHNREAIESMVVNLLQTFRRGLNVEAMNVPVRASIGIAYAPEHGNTVSALLRSADSACAHAKHVGDNSLVVYNCDQQKQAKHRHQLEIGLQQAIEKNELSLQYQPQIDIRSKMTCGMEALIRWHSSEFGRVAPADFIPVAEETGIINRLGDWVLTRAVEDYQRLAKFGTSPTMLSVNLSRKQFEGGQIVTDVDRLLSRTGFDPNKLCLEITETALSSNSKKLQRQLLELTSLGVRLSIDDFGVGYSSLLELRDYPFTEVKIDRAFITNVATDQHSQDIIGAVVDISRSIGAEVVAEGIENQEQFDQVALLGCDRAQGYFLCEPMPATTFPDVVLVK
ncbi:putative bifunctional diguanylate cyclase/phosphodiesterase [Granulosicoccus antarcticus]|uniref:Putative signaling protein n=1 Tax=Granulosicoccus antarcticus IMCC3135 TaxID=1192854 RepID=A0A2Z2NXF8_9GAMM|nr:bifunctional diguanylate cyclase/phosphodiesterase [Granulosicoccus antarcticus]ASJ75943.1 putative signaling protein [Granulosicoccus antarcticus IMCC3135]